jgi:hypothetical protein
VGETSCVDRCAAKYWQVGDALHKCTESIQMPVEAAMLASLTGNKQAAESWLEVHCFQSGRPSFYMLVPHGWHAKILFGW